MENTCVWPNLVLALTSASFCLFMCLPSAFGQVYRREVTSLLCILVSTPSLMQSLFHGSKKLSQDKDHE